MKRHKKNKKHKNLPTEVSNLGYREELTLLSKGSLKMDFIQSESMDFLPLDLSVDDNQYGVLDSSYTQSHETIFDGLQEQITSICPNKELDKEFITKNDEKFESEISENKEIVQNAVASIDNKKGQEVNSTIEKRDNTPIDYIVKSKFLEEFFVRCCGGTVFLYDEERGCYQEQSEASLYVAIRKSLTPEMDIRLTKVKIMDVVHRIISSPELQIKHESFDPHVDLINFKDVVLNTRTGEDYLHSPHFLFTSYIDSDYRENGDFVRIRRNTRGGSGNYFDSFLEDCTQGDIRKIKSLQELTGYIISNEWRAKKFFVLLGLPHTGKSIWLTLWRALIGPKHTTAMSLKQLSDSRFMTAELFQSKLNITAEMDETGHIKGTDIIKMITGGDLITAEKKGKDPFQFYGKTKLVAAGNHMPLLNKLDGTTAFTDRILFLIFNNSIPEARRDKNLMDKLLLEKSYIVNWALEGLRRLKENDLVFTESDDAQRFKQQYISDLNNVPGFLVDRCVVEVNDHQLKVQRRQLYPAYLNYCRDNGERALTKEEFFVEIKKTGAIPTKVRIDGSSPLWGFRGIELRSSFIEVNR